MIENRLGLTLGQPVKRCLQLQYSRSACQTAARMMRDHFVDVIDGNFQPFEDMLALELLVEVVLRASAASTS